MMLLMRASAPFTAWLRIVAASSLAGGALVAACGSDTTDDVATAPDAAAPDVAVDSTPPVDVVDAGSADADASIDAPADAGPDVDAEPPCTDGTTKCNGTGFDTCNDGGWVYRDCAPGTACKPFNGTIVCDFP